MSARDLVDLDRYPLDEPNGRRYHDLVTQARARLDRDGLVDLEGFMIDEARAADLDRMLELFESSAFVHAREHTIYFGDNVDGLAPGHGALTPLYTANRTLCGDDLADSAVDRLYRWPPLRRFVADVCAMPDLHLLADPLACLNVMAYVDGEALDWHFDRAAFTTTLLLQRPEAGGAFMYRKDLRSEADPNHDGVARLLAGEDPDVRVIDPVPGTLTVFRGRHTPHRIARVEGGRPRVIAVLAFAERPDLSFSAAERLGFYGRRGPRPTG
jgi:hypothetical protein